MMPMNDTDMAARPNRLVVTGYAATRPEAAQARAKAVALTLERRLPDMAIETRWKTGSEPVDLADADTIPGQSQPKGRHQGGVPGPDQASTSSWISESTPSPAAIWACISALARTGSFASMASITR